MEKNENTQSDSSARTPRAVTARQREVLELVAVGHGNKEIAHRLRISEPAVKKHLESLRRRYKAANRVQMIRAALEHGDIHLTRKK